MLLSCTDGRSLALSGVPSALSTVLDEVTFRNAALLTVLRAPSNVPSTEVPVKSIVSKTELAALRIVMSLPRRFMPPTSVSVKLSLFTSASNTAPSVSWTRPL